MSDKCTARRAVTVTHSDTVTLVKKIYGKFMMYL